MALAIHLSSYISGGYTNPVVWRLYETGTGVFVDEHQEMGPHGQVYNFSFVNNIKDIVYTVKLYDQPGGTGIGELIKSHDLTVSTSTISFDADIETIVNGGEPEDPTSDTNVSPPIPALVGKSWYVVQRNVGQLRGVRDVEVINNPDGSYQLTSSTFTDQDTYIIKIRPQYVINPAGSVSGSNYKDIELVVDDRVLVSPDFGKLLIVDGVLPVLTLQLPAVVDIIEKVSLTIQAIGTSNINVVIQSAVGETTTATGTTSNTLILSKAVRVELVKLGAVLYGFTDDLDIKCRGQIEWGYSVGLNRLPAYGGEYNVADYPGLKKAMDAMQTGTVVSYAQYNSTSIIDGVTYYPYRGYFALSDDQTKLRVPDLRNLSVRGLNGPGADAQRLTQGPGGYQLGAAAAKYRYTTGTGGDQGDQTTSVGYQGGDPGAAQFRWKYLFSVDAAGNAVTETRPENIGLIPLVII